MKWRCVDKLPIPLEKKQTKKEKIQEILKEISDFGRTLKKEEDKIILRTIYLKIKSLN